MDFRKNPHDNFKPLEQLNELEARFEAEALRAGVLTRAASLRKRKS